MINGLVDRDHEGKRSNSDEGHAGLGRTAHLACNDFREGKVYGQRFVEVETVAANYRGRTTASERNEVIDRRGPRGTLKLRNVSRTLRNAELGQVKCQLQAPREQIEWAAERGALEVASKFLRRRPNEDWDYDVTRASRS